MRTRNPFVPAAIVAALTIGSLAACSSGGNTNYVTSHTPAASSSSSAGSSDDTKSEELPSDFPKSDVPIVDGTVVVARGDKENGWSVTVQPSGKEGFADAKTALEGKGFTQQPGATDSSAVYVSDAYTVAVKTPGVSVTYNVTANQ
ncbi:hypothetical protein [Leifsonia sp. 21MFCrub1.1]|uniref:hypothetical protein n=1 Tax=Leifsonia sp. 21MFCrub1.1 TaxID=1798223 RepID=UPI0008929930|nr:hypothetical protein [Leifsonia sp. 21MFCrub1.1]SEB13178.1 hypothetical protein SAMN04515680_3543 [Leifsonia sp. 21MFCrub1.1]